MYHMQQQSISSYDASSSTGAISLQRLFTYISPCLRGPSHVQRSQLYGQIMCQSWK